MNKNKKTTREIISEMKLMLNDKPKLTLESFIMPESFDDNLGDGIDSFDEEEMEKPSQIEKDIQPQQTEISGIEKELTQIRKIALSVINRLADQPTSEGYNTMKKVWNLVDRALESNSTNGNTQDNS